MNHYLKKTVIRLLLLCLTAICFISCRAAGEDEDPAGADRKECSSELIYDRSMELKYAEGFSVDYYEEGYALITIAGVDRYLFVPEGREAPADLEGDIIVLKAPVERIYLSASGVMDMFVALDALDSLRFSSLKQEGWRVEEAAEAMENGNILYAGKYSAPDYERIVSEKCGLAIENTMIYHTPQVKEQLNGLGIPVLVDYSSYEAEPVGRMEWIKLYGLLTGKEAAARSAFEKQAAVFERVSEEKRETEGKTAAFFYITDDGMVHVRKAEDYVPKMIALAGGEYIFSKPGQKNGAFSVAAMQMEEFYAAAREADYIIYNSTVDGELASLRQLLEKSELLKDFRAVKEGHVFCTTKDMYQSSMELGDILSDIHEMLMGAEEGFTYLYQLH